MAYFTEYESTYNYRNPSNDNTNDTLKYNASAEGTIALFIIVPSSNQVLIEGEEQIDGVANPTGDVTSTIKKGCKIYNASETWKVINQPRYLRLAKVTKLNLKRIYITE